MKPWTGHHIKNPHGNGRTMELPEQRLEPPAPRESEPAPCPYCGEPDFGCGATNDNRTPECYQNESRNMQKSIHGWVATCEKWQAYALRLENAGDEMFNAIWRVQDWKGTSVGDCSDAWTAAKESKP
jgi:hypothetical protein